MAYEPARPRHMLPFDGKEYDIVGTLELVESIEGTFKEGIIQIASRVLSMGLADTSKLVAAMLNASGTPTRPAEASKVIFNKMGVHSEAFTTLQMHLYAFLRVMLEPPEARETMAKTMGELLGKLQQASPGDNTKSSA